MNTSGFYKEQDGDLFHGPNAVYNANFTLLKELHETYTYPVDGWHWFETEELAREFFGLPEADEQQE